MELVTSLFVNVVIALVGALLCAASYALVAKFMRIDEPRFSSVLGPLTWGSLMGVVVGLVVAFLMQMKNYGFPTVESVWGKMAAQYVVTLAAVVAFNKAKVRSGRVWFAVILPPAVLFAALLYSVSHPTLAFAHEMEKRQGCLNHLRQIGLALMMYEADHNAQLPTSLDDLRSMPYKVKIDEIICCPSAAAKGVGVPHYEYHPQGTDVRDEVPVAWDKPGNHMNGRNVLFRGGVVRWCTEDEFARLEKQLKTP